MERLTVNEWNDEHLLARYWLILIRRRWVVVTVFILMIMGGAVYANTRPPLPFPYVTTIEIGSLADGLPLEDIKIVENKVKEAFIPIVLQEHANKNGYDQKRYSIKTEIPEQGNTLILKAYGGQSVAEDLLMLEQKITDLLINEHAQKTELIKKDLEQQRFKSELALEDLKDQGARIPHRRQIVDETGLLLKRQIETVSNLINSAEKDRASALTSAVEKGSIDQSLTTAILLMNTTIADNREKLRSLEERYYITLQNQKSDLDREELANRRQQKEQEQAIKDAEFRADNLQETKIIFPPSQLLRESPKSPGQIVGLFGAVGFFLGIFAAGFIEFAANARKYANIEK